MDIYIWCIIFDWDFENAIDTRSFPTLRNTVDCVNDAFLENSSHVLYFSSISLNTFRYYPVVEPITHLSKTLCLYHCRSMHFGAFSFKKVNKTVK